MAEEPPDRARLEADKYQVSMRELLPRLVAAQVAAAGLSKTYERIDPLVHELYDLDSEVGTALVSYKRGEADAIAQVAAAKNAANSFLDHTVNEVRALLAPGAD